MKAEKDRLFDLMKALADAGVKFVVCGGIACVLQGVERATFDLDILTANDTINLKRLVHVTRRFNLKPRIPEPVENLFDEEKRRFWIEKKGALVYTFVSDNSPLQLDIFLRYPKNYDELLKDADIIKIENIKIYVSSVEDLIMAKKKIKPLRDKDITDIKELEKKLYDSKK